MKFLTTLCFLFIVNTIIFSGEEKEYDSFPKFVPYINESIRVEQTIKTVDIKNLGYESPARWLSVDPLAEKYPGWSPYNYTLCNPVRFIDPNGDSVVVLQQTEGALGLGHTGILIGNESEGWQYFSKNGAKGFIYGFGPSNKPNIGAVTKDNFDNIADFRNKYKHYDKGFLIESDGKTDMMMIRVATREVQSWQLAIGNNCIDVVSNTLESVGINGGTQVIMITNPKNFIMSGSYISKSPIPNIRYQAIINNNHGIIINDLLK